MPQQLCKVCGQWLSCNSPDWEKHLLSDRHQKRLNQIAERKKYEENGIFVTGFRISNTLTVEMLIAHFSKFGVLDNHFIDKTKNFAILHYKSKEAAQQALNTPSNIDTCHLVVRPKRQNPQRAGGQGDVQPAAQLVRNIVIGSVGSWEMQAERLANKLGLNDNSGKNARLAAVCRDITFALRRCFPNCRPHVFGSCVTGLAGPDSDVDIFIDITPDYEYLSPIRKELLAKDPIKFKAEMICICKNYLESSNHFSNFLYIPKSRTPLIKCVHRRTELQCDINIKSCLSVINTNLLKYYFDLNYKVRLMIIILKHWAKVNRIAMSSYALSFVMLFYLMRLPEPLVPPVITLLDPHDNAPEEERWKTSFRKIPFKSNNTQTLKDLLTGFFHFCKSFDYGVDVMCVRTGEILPKWIFLKASTLPLSMDKLQRSMDEVEEGLPVKNCAVCVQDPMELVHNITRSMAAKNLLDFRALCTAVAGYCNTENANLDQLMAIERKQPFFDVMASNFIEIHLEDYFPAEVNLGAGNRIRDMWFQHASSVIWDIFKYIFYFNEDDNEGDTSKSHLPVKNDKDGMPQHVVIKTLSSKFSLWTSRKHYKPDESMQRSLFAQEVDISNKIVNKHVKNESLGKRLHIKIILTYNNSPTHILVEVLDVSSDKILLFNFLSFLSVHLQTFVNKGLSSDYQNESDILTAKEIINKLKESSQQTTTSTDANCAEQKCCEIAMEVQESVAVSQSRSLEKPDMHSPLTVPQQGALKKPDMHSSLTVPQQGSVEKPDMHSSLTVPQQGSVEKPDMHSSLTVPQQGSLEKPDMHSPLTVPQQESLEKPDMHSPLTVPQQGSLEKPDMHSPLTIPQQGSLEKSDMQLSVTKEQVVQKSDAQFLLMKSLDVASACENKSDVSTVDQTQPIMDQQRLLKDLEKSSTSLQITSFNESFRKLTRAELSPLRYLVNEESAQESTIKNVRNED